MRHDNCENCGVSIPVGEMFAVAGQNLCEPCANQYLTDQQKSTSERIPVARRLDPTVCFRCSADGGDSDWPRIGALPVCDACERHCRNWPFPPWIKAACAAVIALAVFSFQRNERFFSAHINLTRAGHAVQDGRIEEAADRLTAASERLPERREIGALASFYRGAVLLKDDKPAEALEQLRAARQTIPGMNGIDLFVLMAEAGVAFDSRDYDAFLEKSKRIQQQNPLDSLAKMWVASALACKYAVSGEESFKEEAFRLLDEASRSSDGAGPEFLIASQHVRYRLATREVISKKEFLRRFPSGWHEVEGSK